MKNYIVDEESRKWIESNYGKGCEYASPAYRDSAPYLLERVKQDPYGYGHVGMRMWYDTLPGSQSQWKLLYDGGTDTIIEPFDIKLQCRRK